MLSKYTAPQQDHLKNNSQKLTEDKIKHTTTSHTRWNDWKSLKPSSEVMREEAPHTILISGTYWKPVVSTRCHRDPIVTKSRIVPISPARHFERLSKHSGFILSATVGVWNEEAAPSKDTWSKVPFIPVLTEQQLEGCLLVQGARLEHTAEPRLNSRSEHSAVKQKRKKKSWQPGKEPFLFSFQVGNAH